MVTPTGLSAAVAALHATLRRETDRLAFLVRAVGAGDVGLAEALGSWAFDVVDALHHYLQGHEAYLRPAVLAGRTDDRRAWDTMAAAGRDQREVERASSAVQAAAIRWQDGAAVGDRDALAAGLERLRPLVERALRRIEDEVAPLADEHAAPDVRGRVVAHPVRALGGARGRALLGAMIAADDEHDVDWVLHETPGVVRAVQRRAARRAYERRTAAFAAPRTRRRSPGG